MELEAKVAALEARMEELAAMVEGLAKAIAVTPVILANAIPDARTTVVRELRAAADARGATPATRAVLEAALKGFV
ncbi:MAG TPA: hypothetical protein VMN79_00130 [Casimicrobiaceae bacterium]|nr:hypothetical protein [Casimicrobiaceae bacterium]